MNDDIIECIRDMQTKLDVAKEALTAIANDDSDDVDWMREAAANALEEL